MRSTIVGMIVLLLALGAPAAQAAECDRACLASALDRFLHAVEAHRPTDANLWVGFRQTENAVLTAPGTGIWQSNTGIGKVDRRYFDPAAGMAAFFGTIKEGGKTAVASVRIRVERGQVSEAEWHLARADDPGIMGAGTKPTYDLANLEAHPPAARTVPPADRRSREELVAAVNSYFDGIVLGSGRYVAAHRGCERFENGMGGQDWTRKPPPPADAAWNTSSDCRAGYGSLNIVNVGSRRYLMVDEDAQVVVASAVFVREPLSPKRRNCFMEYFYLDGGKIRQVYAAMAYVDARRPVPNWAPYDGNFALPPAFVPAN